MTTPESGAVAPQTYATAGVAAPTGPAARPDQQPTRPHAEPLPAAGRKPSAPGLAAGPGTGTGADGGGGGLGRAAMITAGLAVAGSVLGLVRDQGIAHFFGAGAASDAFLVSWTVPELAATVLIEDAMALLMVPAFAAALARRGGDPVRELVRATLPRLTLLLAAVAAALALAAPAVVDVLAPGLADHRLAVDCTRLTAVSVLTFGLTGYLSAALRAHRRYVPPAAIYVAYNVGIIATLFALHAQWGARAAAAGVALGGLLMAAIQLPSFATQLRPHHPPPIPHHRKPPKPSGRPDPHAPPDAPGRPDPYAPPEDPGPRSPYAWPAASDPYGPRPPYAQPDAPGRPELYAPPAAPEPRSPYATCAPLEASAPYAATAPCGPRPPCARPEAAGRPASYAPPAAPEADAPYARPEATGPPAPCAPSEAPEPRRAPASDAESATTGPHAPPEAARGGVALALVAPVIVFTVGRQAQVLIERFFAAPLPAGAISHLNYAQKVAQMPMMLSLMICAVSFPVVSQALARGEGEKARRRVERDLTVVCAVVLLGTAFLIACAPQLIEVLFQRGEFTAADTTATAAVIRVYAVGLLGQSLVGALIRPYFSAARPTWYPAGAMAAGLLVTVVTDAAAVGRWGAYGIAAGNAAGITLTAALLVRGLRGQTIGVGARHLLGTVARIALAAAAAAGTGWLLAAAVPNPLAATAVCCLAVPATFVLAAAATKVPEVPHLLANVKRRLPHA